MLCGFVSPCASKDIVIDLTHPHVMYHGVASKSIASTTVFSSVVMPSQNSPAGMEPRRCALVTFLLAARTARGGPWGPTCVADSLNDMIRGGGSKRTECTSTTRWYWCVPCWTAWRTETLWSCQPPSGPTTSMRSLRCTPIAWNCSAYSYATFGFVVGSAVLNLFHDFDAVQSAQWGYGVIYVHDLSSVDLQCRWLGSLQVYDCPGGYIPW